MWPGVHQGPRESKIYVAPETEFAAYSLGNMSSQRIQFVVAHNGPGSETRVHSHPDQYQIYYVVSGRVLIRNGEEWRECGPGDTIFTPPDTDHGYRNPFPGWMTLLDLHSYQYEGLVPSRLRVSRIVEGPQSGSGQLRYDDREEVYYVTSGTVVFTVATETGEAEAGGVVYIPRGAEHSYRNVGTEPVEMVVITSYDLAA